MATLQQIEANRANAQKSTGPHSVEGRAAVRFNALKTGIDAQSQVIPGEDPAALALLAAEYYDRYQPATPEVRAALVGAFGILAAALAAIGLYGVMSYAVGHRTREIGVRMALGAQRLDVLAMVLRQSMTLVAAGLAAGLLGALALTRLLREALYGLTPTDPKTYAGVSLLFVTVALAAAYLPARRAVRIEPVTALRHE